VAVAALLDGSTVRISVSDEGPGITPEDAVRIWQPFYRTPAAARTAGGAGIGLAVVKELLERQAGRVWVEAAPHGGARFVVELPAAVTLRQTELTTPAAANV
jgi:signal transduction histidine kinase